jgi:hypothetical protein
MNKLLLSLAPPDTWRTFGFRLLVGALIAEALVIVIVPSGPLEKGLSVCCTLLIAAGVWIEEAASHAIAAPRHLSDAERRQLTAKMQPFKGLRAVLGAVPPSANNVDLLNQLLQVLTDAEVDAFINLQGVEASISPTGSSNRGRLLRHGFPSGVTLHYVAGNSRAKTFSETLAQALNDLRITADAVPDGRDDEWVERQIATAAASGVTLTRDSREFEPVVVVVGDKP